MITGSCLCGLIHYAVEEPGIVINLCHCSKCRKSSGAAFGSVMHIGLERFRWLEGAGFVRAYATESGYGRSFCNRCGSPVPSVSEHTGNVAIPAGTLDGDPRCEPVGHIYTGSSAAFFDCSRQYPHFPEAPSDEIYDPYIERYLSATGLDRMDFREAGADDFETIAVLAGRCEAATSGRHAGRFSPEALAAGVVHFVAEEAQAQDQSDGLRAPVATMVGYAGAEEVTPGHYEWHFLIDPCADFGLVAGNLYHRMAADAAAVGAASMRVDASASDPIVGYLLDRKFAEVARFVGVDDAPGVTLEREEVMGAAPQI
jgi:hypothetical protein